MSKRIELFGVTASGKSTLLHELSRMHASENILICLENLNPIDWARNAWRSNQASQSTIIQCIYYIRRLEQLQTAKCDDNTNIVSDFGLETDHCIYSTTMAQMENISHDELQWLTTLYTQIKNLVTPLAGLIYRKYPIETIIQRLESRGGYCGDFDVMLSQLIHNADEAARLVKYPVHVIEGDLTEKSIRNAYQFITDQLSQTEC